MTLIIRSGWLALLTSTLLISACSSHVPPEIEQPPEDNPSIAEVRTTANKFIGEKVRWGGTILKVENKQDASWLTIIAFPLRDDGEPRDSDHSPGRFIAIFNDFLEPEVYSAERQITVTGRLVRSETHKVGEFLYEYPVIQVEHFHLWPVPPEPSDIDYPPYGWHHPWHHPYDPWYHPYY